jgi:valyl-tRNA synthetase
MSKSLGNSPDPIELIEKYGADGVRVGMLLTSPAGNDLPFDEELCEQGRNFSNKIWNAFRLIKGWQVDEKMEQPEHARKANDWFQAKLSLMLANLEKAYADYRISEALMMTYKFIWDDFSSWYLEMVKPDYQKPIDQKTFSETQANFEQILKILHPFMPFITEEIWQDISQRAKDEALIISPWPEPVEMKLQLVEEFDFAAEVISGIRNIRKEKNVPQKEQLQVLVMNADNTNTYFDGIIMRLTNLERVQYIQEKPEGAVSFRVKGNEYFIPLQGYLNIGEEIEKLQNELKYTRGFLHSVQNKLSNEKFVAGAPEQVVAVERKKESDALIKIKLLEDSIAKLRS